MADSYSQYYYNKLTVEQANAVDVALGLYGSLHSTQALRQREAVARLLLNGEPRRG